MTIKELADEIGVSKQAVYKRLTGKLASVCAPYVHTEHSKTLLSDEAVNIIKSDFEKNPCLSALHTEHSITSVGAHTEHIRSTYEESLKDTPLKEENEQLKSEIAELQEQLSETRHQLELKEQEITMLNQTIEELKTDKADLKQHRDTLTNALTVSKSDLARLENIVTKMAALPLTTRIFKWTDTVAYLTEYESPKLDIVDVDIDE